MITNLNTPLIIFGFVILTLNIRFINPVPDYGQYSFDIFGDFSKEDVLNSMAFHYDFGKNDGFISFSFDSFNQDFKRINFIMPPNTKYKNVSLGNGINVNVETRGCEPSCIMYVVEFPEPVSKSFIKFEFASSISPNGAFSFNTQPAYGWTIRLFMNQYKCQTNCITHLSDEMTFFYENKPDGAEILIRKEKDAGEYAIHHVRFNIESYDSSLTAWNQFFFALSTGLIVAGLVNIYYRSKAKTSEEELVVR